MYGHIKWKRDYRSRKWGNYIDLIDIKANGNRNKIIIK